MSYKKILTYLTIGVLCSSSIGCQKDFLETNPSTQVSDQVLFKSVDGAQTLLNGTYAYMRLRNQDVEYGTIVQFENGFDAASNDLIVRASMGYLQSYYAHNLAETRADAPLTANAWSYFYTIINNANLVINNIDAIEGDASTKDAIKGQALAIRGWAYFYLVRLYQQHYSGAKDMPAVPYYSQGATTEGKPREKVSVIYANVLADLKSSIDLLGTFSRQFKSQIDKTVAQGILAEVYLTMEDWTNAAATANAAKSSYPLLTPTEFKSGFNSEELEEWMWSAPQSSDSNFGNASPFALWANQTRGTRWTFDFLYVNDTFKNLFETKDVRNQFWFRKDHGFWTSDKFRDAADFYGDVVLMRAAEMYLIEAEANARLGNTAGAQSVLWQLQDIRQATRSTSTGTALIDDILVERRKELYSEGQAWFDLIRTHRPVHRTGDHPSKPEIPAYSWKFILQLPTNEFTSNKSLTPADQNPYEGIYVPK
jgi:hypothetical protein